MGKRPQIVVRKNAEKAKSIFFSIFESLSFRKNLRSWAALEGGGGVSSKKAMLFHMENAPI